MLRQKCFKLVGTLSSTVGFVRDSNNGVLNIEYVSKGRPPLHSPDTLIGSHITVKLFECSLSQGYQAVLGVYVCRRYPGQSIAI
jgi:hypothetical protein